MDLNSFHDLFTLEGQAALAAAAALEPREADFLADFQALAKEHPRELARSALETAILRREAAQKFPFAERMFFTRPALEQATAYPVSTYRAARLRGFDRLVDLGCSIGGDTLALARYSPVLGIDLDPLRLAMARANLLAAAGQSPSGPVHPARFIRADLTRPLPLLPDPRERIGLFFDPARRKQGRRVYSLHTYLPPLETLAGWLPRFPGLGVKISPGVQIEALLALEALRPFPMEIEFISLGGDLKEAVLWFGPLRSAARRATLLPGPHTLTTDQSFDQPGPQRLPVEAPRAYLYEPDPAVLRAGLVQDLGVQLDAAQIDADIAYLTADRRIETPFARSWEVEAWFPFNLKHLRAALRERGVGRVTVKKRGSPLQPEKLIRDLRLEGDQERIVFLSHLRGQPVIILCYP